MTGFSYPRAVTTHRSLTEREGFDSRPYRLFEGQANVADTRRLQGYGPIGIWTVSLGCGSRRQRRCGRLEVETEGSVLDIRRGYVQRCRTGGDRRWVLSRNDVRRVAIIVTKLSRLRRLFHNDLDICVCKT